MYLFFSNTLVILGVLILISTHVPVRKLINQLPKGSIQNKWIVQSILIFFFILGYIGYALKFWHHAKAFEDLIVPMIFFLGATFVRMTITLSLQTAQDLQHVNVLEQENITDPLIGIYNRRCLDRRVNEEFQRAQRTHNPLSLILIDIDHFKQINDTYGHQIGDVVLRHWGNLIRNSIRETDIVARYGGEEIMIITPNTSACVAASLAERICRKIESHEVVLNCEPYKGTAIRITVSIGVAELTPACDCADKLFTIVDQALYEAKHNGRNRVILYNELMTARLN